MLKLEDDRDRGTDRDKGLAVLIRTVCLESVPLTLNGVDPRCRVASITRRN